MSDSKAKKTKKIKADKAVTAVTAKPNEENVLPLKLIDVTCPVCLSIMIEPVTMPCTHALCMSCFELNVSESNLACPLCRKRISIWVRKMTKIKGLVDQKFWKRIQEGFKEEIAARQKGEDDLNNTFTSTIPTRKVCAPGEIKEEYEAELKRIREEEEDQRKKEEDISSTVLIKLQEEEKRRLAEQSRLSSDDFEFARQIRTSQMKEAVSSLRRGKAKRSPLTPSRKAALPPSSSSSAGTAASPRAATLDFYLSSQATPAPSPSTSSNWFAPALGHSTPIDAPSAFDKLKKNRFLKDITSNYSSESESEFDSEENIRRSKKAKGGGRHTAPATDKENKQGRGAAGAAQAECELNEGEKEFPREPREEQSAEERAREELLRRVFDGKEVDEALLNELMAEQKEVEERLRQEKEDRLFALRLQKDMKKIDRTKGSIDEYRLRTKPKSTKRPAQFSPELPLGHQGEPSTAVPRITPNSTNENTSTNDKFRQTTLLESLGLFKKQRRL